MHVSQAPAWVRSALNEGLVIPAHPLALTSAGTFDPRYQRALTRYYAAAGAGGVAVAVHTTQFEIRRPEFGLLRPVLACTAEALNEIERQGGPRLVRIAGVCGATPQAVAEARQAGELGYHAGLLSLSALPQASDADLVRHCRSVADVLPIVGFYLQPAAGGRLLSYDFWRQFAEIPNVLAIKMAPFNRYQTLDVIRGVAAAGRAGEIALYTGNDDNIVMDLLTPFEFEDATGATVRQRIVGGLLGHWAVWTSQAVALHRRCRAVAAGGDVAPAMLTQAAQVTDANAALFDVAHAFAGAIAGVQHVLHAQGLLPSTRCLSPREVLSPGQSGEIERVRRAYPFMIDDDFVSTGLRDWLA